MLVDAIRAPVAEALKTARHDEQFTVPQDYPWPGKKGECWLDLVGGFWGNLYGNLL